MEDSRSGHSPTRPVERWRRSSFRTSTGHFDIILSKTDLQRIKRECGRAIKELDQKGGNGNDR